MIKKIGIFVIMLFLSFNFTIIVNAKTNDDYEKKSDTLEGVNIKVVNKKYDENFYDSFFDGLVYSENIENYDYFELIEYEITPFMNWLESSFDLTNSLDIEFVDNNINKIILKAINLGIISDIFNKPQTRFSTSTHEQITQDSLTLLSQDNKNSVYAFYSNYFWELKQGSKQPDDDEMYAGHHYYISNTVQSDGYYQNRSDDYSISARTRFEEHYYTAINAYKNGLINVAMNELGRSLHYLQDTACVPHSSGLASSGSLSAHVLYENWIKLAYPGSTNYIASSANEFYSVVLNLDNPGEILNQVSDFSYQYKDIVQNHKKDTTDLTYSYYVTVASACLPYSQKITAAVLNRFYEDVTNESRNISYMKDGTVYYIKNVGTGDYIDVKSWSTENDAVTHPYSFHGDINQQFRAEIQDDGSFKFTPMNAPDKKLHISRVLDIFEELNITSNGHNFRPVYYKNGKYRLIPEYDSDLNNTAELRYYKYPIIQRNDQIMVWESDIWTPSNSNYYWEFQEAPSVSTGETDIFLGKSEIKKVIINIANTGYYDIETLGSVDTYFVDLSYRIGTGNTNLTVIRSYPNDDDGEGLNAKYSEVYLEEGKIYILTLRGYSATNAGPISIKISGDGPDAIIEESTIRTNPYTITDEGRFTNSYDIINLYSIFGESVSFLKQAGYTKVTITLEFYAYEINDGYQYFWIYDGTSSSSTSLYERQFEHTPESQDSNSKRYIFNDIEFDLDDIINNSVYLRYGASGTGDDTWINYGVTVNIKIY